MISVKKKSKLHDTHGFNFSLDEDHCKDVFSNKRRLYIDYCRNRDCDVARNVGSLSHVSLKRTIQNTTERLTNASPRNNNSSKKMCDVGEFGNNKHLISFDNSTRNNHKFKKSCDEKSTNETVEYSYNCPYNVTEYNPIKLIFL